MFDDMHQTIEDLAATKNAGTRLLASSLLDSTWLVVAMSGKPNSGLTTDRAKHHDAIMALQPRTLYRTGNADCPKIEVTFLDYPDYHLNALGARGVGEIGMAGVAAAVANAVYHATGKRIRDLPITVDKLL